MDVELAGWNCVGLLRRLILFLTLTLTTCERSWTRNLEDEIREGNLRWISVTTRGVVTAFLQKGCEYFSQYPT